MATAIQPRAGCLHRPLGTKPIPVIAGFPHTAHVRPAARGWLPQRAPQPLALPRARSTAAAASAAVLPQSACDESSARTQQALAAATGAAAVVAAWCIAASAFQGTSLFATLTLAAADNNGERVARGPCPAHSCPFSLGRLGAQLFRHVLSSVWQRAGRGRGAGCACRRVACLLSIHCARTQASKSQRRARGRAWQPGSCTRCVAPTTSR